MSETTATTEKPEATAAASESAAPAAPVEKPFTVDVLTSCTARFSRKAWDIFLSFRKENLDLMKTFPLRASLTTRSAEGAVEIEKLLKEAGVTELVGKGKVIEMTATFAQIQAVIKHPEAAWLEAVKHPSWI